MTSCNGYYLSRSVADSGFIVADSELGDFVIANILSPQPDLAWRGDSTADLLIQLNLKQFELMDTLALCSHNMTGSATVTIELYDSRANAPLLTVTETVGTAYTIPAYKNLISSFQDVNAQEIDITISDTGNPDGYVQIRRLKLGVMTVRTTGFDYGYTFGFVSGEKYRAGEITWMWNTEEELNDVNEIIRDFGVDPDRYARTRAGELLGFDDDILWLGYPEATNARTLEQHTALVALVSADIPYRPNAAQGVFTARFEEIFHEIAPEVPTAFITTWRTTTANETITLPATGVNSFVVDWGDGSTELVTTASPSHEYAVAGDHVVSIEGICRKWYQNNAGDNTKIIELSQWGNVGFNEISSAFSGCSNMVITALDTPDFSAIEDFSNQFLYCSAATSFPFHNWDVSSGRFFNGQFAECSAATSFTFQNWDVSSGEDFQYQFFNCSAATSYGVDSWSIPAATDMTDMFLLSGLTDTEYDLILVAWAAQVPLAANYNMHFGTAQYSAGAAATARAALVSDGITITDGGAA